MASIISERYHLKFNFYIIYTNEILWILFFITYIISNIVLIHNIFSYKNQMIVDSSKDIYTL